jgi:transcription antitermination protein NusB
MLNRRLVRIRVMQTLFALEKGREANYLLSQDEIAERFAPDLNSVVKQDVPFLNGQKKLALQYFEEEIKHESPSNDADLSIEISSALKIAREFLKQKNKKDEVFFQRQIVNEAEETYTLYLYLLKLIVDLKNKFPANSGLQKIKAIKALEENKSFQQQTLLKGIHYEKENGFITRLYKEALVSNTHLNEFFSKINLSSEDELSILKYLIKNILLKHEVVTEFFEKKFIYWTEDTDILRTMLNHSFVDIADGGTVNIEVLDEMWEETRYFMTELFNKCISEEKEVLEILKPKLSNWDFDRLLFTDRILLKMAIVELIHFPSIPIKVSINEIIEIAKNYGSEKSGHFVNGILDGLTKFLISENKIKKTGRGMLDNK